MTPEESLAATLKQKQRIILGQTIGTDINGNCTVQNEQGTILARAEGDISAGSCVALKADDGQWYAVSARQSGTVASKTLFNRKSIPKTDSESADIIYLLVEVETNVLYVSDGVTLEEIASFDVLGTAINGTITKTGPEFGDWIVTGFYKKDEAESNVTADRFVSFYITPSETLTEEVKYLSEDVVNSLILVQHQENAELSSENLLLSRQFRIGETVYSSSDNFVTPIVVTTTNEAKGALTTRFAAGFDFGYGWMGFRDRLKDNSDEFGGGRKRGASLYRGRINTSSLPSTAPENDTTRDMRTGGYYTFGTYSGSSALIVRSLTIDFESGLPAKIRFFRDVIAESLDELVDLSAETIQNDVYDLTPLGTTPVSGGFLSAYAITLNGDSISALPIPVKDTIALLLIDGDEFTYVDVYFNQKEGFVRRKMYEFSMSGDHNSEVWLNQERMITQKVGYKYIQGYKLPTSEDPDNFVGSEIKRFREISTLKQGSENETQLFTKTLDLIDSAVLRSNAFYVDAEGEQNLVEQINYFDENPDPPVLPAPLEGNLIGNEIIFMSLVNTDGDIAQVLQTIDLSSLPLEAIETPSGEVPEIDTGAYGFLSQSFWSNN